MAARGQEHNELLVSCLQGMVDYQRACAATPFERDACRSGIYRFAERLVDLHDMHREGLSEADLWEFTGRDLSMKTQSSRSPSTWERAINLVGAGALDLAPLVTHRVPLDRGVEAFPLLRTDAAIKVLVTMG